MIPVVPVHDIARHLLKHRVLYCILLLSAVLRAPLLFTSQSHVDSDAAEIGLMAKHILEKGEHTIYAWKQPYTGGYSIEAHLAVPLFCFWGISVQSLKMVGLLLSIVLLAVSYFFTGTWFGRRTAVVSTLLLSLATPLLQWNLQMRGGYLEAMILTVLMFSIMFQIHEGGKNTRTYYAVWGFLSGLAWWNSEIVLPFLTASVVIWCAYERKFIFTGKFAVFVLFFLIGSSPAIYYNVTHDFLNLRYVFGDRLLNQNAVRSGITAGEWLKGRAFFFFELMTATLPRFFEPDNEWSYFRRISIFSWIQYLLLISALGYSLLSVRASGRLLTAKTSILVYVFVYLAADCLMNPYGPQVQRFLLLLYPYISIIEADFMIAIYDLGRRTKYLGVVMLLFAAAIGEASYLGYMGKKSQWMDPDPTGPYIRTEGDTISGIISFLRIAGIRYVHTTHYIKYRIIFESDEDIIASSEFFRFEKDYFPYYEAMVRKAAEQPVAVVLYRMSRYVPFLQEVMRKNGISFKRKEVGEMVIFYPFPGERLLHVLSSKRGEKPSFGKIGDLPGKNKHFVQRIDGERNGPCGTSSPVRPAEYRPKNPGLKTEVLQH